MKRSACFWVICLGMALGYCSGADLRPEFSKISMDLSFQDPPRIRGTNTTTGGTRVTGANSRWAVFRVRFTPVVYEVRRSPALTDAQNRANIRRNAKGGSIQREFRITNGRKITGFWLDDVVMQIRVVLVDTKSGKQSGYSEVTGQSQFWAIAMDGREHNAVMYVPPQLLDRLMPASGPKAEASISGRAAQRNDFRVEVAFYHKHYGVVGRGYFGMKGRRETEESEEFEELVRSIGGRNIFHGGVLSRGQTPWGLSNMDNYDLVKPDYIPPPINVGKATDAE